VARPSYLSRTPSGRYYLQRRLGKLAAAAFGQPVLRVSLRTGNFQEARRRLTMVLGWVNEIVDAPDLDALGRLFDRQLWRHIDAGEPRDERTLADRLALEHQIRQFMVRANERGYPFPKIFPNFASRWVDFVDQNKATEAALEYSKGSANTPASCLPKTEMPVTAFSEFDPETSMDLIRQIVLEQLDKQNADRLTHGAEAKVAPLAPEVPALELVPSPPSSGDRMSDVLAEFLRPPSRKRTHTSKGRSEAKAVIQFAIDFLSDPVLKEVGASEWAALDEALPDIPHTTNIPKENARSLFARYKYAQDHEWKGLVRLTEKSIKSRYWHGLHKFIDWSIANKYYLGPKPKFECIDPENLASLPRDAFEDKEILNILGLPLFTGCLNRTHVWKPGKYFVQSAIYWGYLICLFTGMRPGEVGQLECSQVRTDGTFFCFDLRPFDARNGRVALEDLRNLKTNAAGRVVPINPLLIELGLLERMEDLLDRKERRLFPEWERYVRSDGTERWSQPLSKSWQYLKNKVLKTTRADVSLYSTRHFFADILDSNTVAQRTRDRILGHVGDVRGRYGRKGVLDPTVAAQIEALEPPVMRKVRELLLDAKKKADVGELRVLKTYLSPSV
jgi:integrase